MIDISKIKTNITKSRSGHYTTTLNYNRWPLYKATKLNNIHRARALAELAKSLIALNAYENSNIQGEFITVRINRLVGGV